MELNDDVLPNCVLIGLSFEGSGGRLGCCCSLSSSSSLRLLTLWGAEVHTSLDITSSGGRSGWLRPSALRLAMWGVMGLVVPSIAAGGGSGNPSHRTASTVRRIPHADVVRVGM